MLKMRDVTKDEIIDDKKMLQWLADCIKLVNDVEGMDKKQNYFLDNILDPTNIEDLGEDDPREVLQEFSKYFEIFGPRISLSDLSGPALSQDVEGSSSDSAETVDRSRRITLLAGKNNKAVATIFIKYYEKFVFFRKYKEEEKKKMAKIIFTKVADALEESPDLNVAVMAKIVQQNCKLLYGDGILGQKDMVDMAMDIFQGKRWGEENRYNFAEWQKKYSFAIAIGVASEFDYFTASVGGKKKIDERLRRFYKGEDKILLSDAFIALEILVHSDNKNHSKLCFLPPNKMEEIRNMTRRELEGGLRGQEEDRIRCNARRKLLTIRGGEKKIKHYQAWWPSQL
ncbi:MAG: hypothetical protein LBU15_00885 [Rickettsiales bacterium]|jgi:hypothetical protein|nr:hypothetical protein [Rickettsiales bacterium]